MFNDRRMDKKDGILYIYIYIYIYTHTTFIYVCVCILICKTTECYLSLRKKEFLSFKKKIDGPWVCCTKQKKSENGKYFFVVVKIIQNHNDVLSTTVTIFYIRSSEHINFITESWHLFTNISPLTISPSSTLFLSVWYFCFFVFRFHM